MIIENKIQGNEYYVQYSDTITGDVWLKCRMCYVRQELGTGNCSDGGEYWKCNGYEEKKLIVREVQSTLV